MAYIGWLLPEWEKLSLLETFPPRYPDLVAHHVTLAIGKETEDMDLPTADTGKIVGVADDGVGIQALVVEIDGTTERPGLGGTYHITWSLDKEGGYSPKMSNDVIAVGWTPVSPISITLTPKFFRY